MAKQLIKRVTMALLLCAFAVCLALGISLLVPQAQQAYAEETDPNVHTDHDSSWTALTDGMTDLADGYYYLSGNFNGNLTINGTVTLCLNGHVLTGTGSDSVITVNNGGNFTLCDCCDGVEGVQNAITIDGEEFTYNSGVITGGTGKEVYNVPEYTSGGGVYVESNTKFTMEGGTIAGNSATEHGGGVYVSDGTFSMEGGTISANTADYVGGVYVNGIFTMEGGTISDNTAGQSGGVYVNGIFTMEGGTISDNTADQSGGGVYVSEGRFNMEGGTISGNTANYGGGVYVYSNARFTMEGGAISGNTANYGGGVYVWDTFNMEGGAISGNTATSYGGGVYVYGTFTMEGGYFGTNAIDKNVNATANIYGGYFAAQQTNYIAAGNTCVQIDNSDPGYKEGYNYRVGHAHANDDDTYTWFTAISAEGGTLNGGNYYLPYDVTLTNNITIDSDVTLCLNGHILRGNGNGSVVRINSGTFTLCDCNGSNGEHDYYINDSGLYVVDDGTEDWNTAYTAADEKGAITGGVITGGTGIINGNNTCGGGVSVNDNRANFIMEGGTISGNSADEGGGVYVHIGTFIMIGGEISGNNAAEWGGGVEMYGGTFEMSGGTISGNNAAEWGGGVEMYGGTFEMSGGEILYNNASQGGGVDVYDGTFEMSSGYFGANTIYRYGGTVYITGGYFASDPASYVSEGYINGSTHTVVQLSDENHYGDEDYLQGYPYAVYLSGQTPDYAVEDVNATYGTNYTPNVSNNIHNAGITYSYISGEQTVSELPSVVGQHNVTAAFAATVVTDDDGTKTYYPSDTETFTVTISPVITTTSLEDATYGTEYNQTLGINPAGSATWSITSGSLPAGLTLNESTGVISGTPMDVGGRYIFTVCATVNGISTEQEFSIMLNKASQSAPAANEGYIIDYSAETITILDGYEVYTAQDSGTQIISGSITNYIGQTVYIRLAETDTHNLSGWTEVTISARPNTPSSVTGSYAVSTTDDTKFVYTITAIEGAEYSKDGTSWQKSNVFDGITPESTVTFYARIAATDSSFVSTAASVEVEFNKLAGSGTVEITGWTEGESANAPSPTSTTNGTANVTYLYVSTDGAGYSSEQAPTNAGSYCVTATFAETAVYAEVTVYCDFTIAECMAIVAFDGKIEYCATVNEAFDYANELETYADGEGADANGRAIITLQSNVTTSATLTVSSGNYITLDLNGYMLRMTGSGSVISVSGDLLLSDAENSSAGSHEVGGVTYDTGVITGGTGTNDGYTYGGGVYVGSNGTFEMSGGTIAGNSATGDGGGVYVKGTFTMENGTIAYNAAGGGSCGGGVYVGGTFTMENGTISGNTAGIGGGVYVYDTFTMNGGTVSDNAAGNGDGVYVSGDFTMNGGEISGNEGHGVFVYNESTFNMKGGYFGNNTIEVFTIPGLSDYDGHVYITGGYFASDPASYASADYINSLTHTVVKLADDNHYGDEDYVQGYPYAVYKLVAIGNAVYHTNGTNRDYNRQPLVCDENGDFYITATYADESEVPHGLIAISYKLVGGTGDYTTTAPTNAGTYYIGVNISAVADGTNKVYYAGAQIVDDNYFTFTINKIQVAVPVAASGLEYTGGLLTGVAVAEDMDGIYTVTGGSATNVGNHTATVGLVDTINYEWADPEFDGTVSWSIAKRALTADMFQVTGSYTYTGAEREATYTFADRGGSLAAADFEVSYSNNVNAGNSAVITFTAAANGNYSGSVSLNFSIAKADYDMSGISFGNATYTYDGTEKTLVITGELPSGVIVSYTTNTLTNAGSLEVTASFTGDTANYNAIADMTATLTINKATYNMSGISFENATYTYDGNEKTLVISGTLPSGVTVTYTTNTLTNAGSIEVTASFTGDADNYNAIADMTATLTIEKATYDMSGIKFEDVTYTYDGSEKTLVITGNLPDGVTVSYTTNTLTNAGSVEVTASFMGDTDNYNAIADMTATITVDKATYDISGVKFEDATYTYDGEDKTLTISGTLPDGVTVSYTTNTLTNAGSIEVTAMFTGDANNYNTIAPMTATLTIEKATPEYTMPDGLTAVTGQTLDEIELPDGWSWQDGTLSVGEAGENTFTAVYTPVDTDNYNVVTVEINVTVEQATDNTIHYIIWGCIAGIAVVGAVIGWIIVVCVKKRRAKNGE